MQATLFGARAAIETQPRAVYLADFPDPGILRDGPWYYAYGTCSGSIHIQVARSRDLEQWEWLGEALPSLPAWQPSVTA